MKNIAIEFHDSTLGAVRKVGDNIQIRLSPAYIHISDGRPGIDSGTGWTQDAVITLLKATITSGQLPSEVFDIAAGSLKIGSNLFTNCCPLPLQPGRIEPNLELTDGTKFAVEAETGKFELLGTAQFVENFKSCD